MAQVGLAQVWPSWQARAHPKRDTGIGRQVSGSRAVLPLARPSRQPSPPDSATSATHLPGRLRPRPDSATSATGTRPSDPPRHWWHCPVGGTGCGRPAGHTPGPAAARTPPPEQVVGPRVVAPGFHPGLQRLGPASQGVGRPDRATSAAHGEGGGVAAGRSADRTSGGGGKHGGGRCGGWRHVHVCGRLPKTARGPPKPDLLLLPLLPDNVNICPDALGPARARLQSVSGVGRQGGNGGHRAWLT